MTKGERVGLKIARISPDVWEATTPRKIAKLRGATELGFLT